MAQEKISPEWHKQYKKEMKWDRDFRYAASSKSLKGGIGNPKNWPGGKSEMNHDPHFDRKKITAQEQSKSSGKSKGKKTRKRISTKR